MSNYSKQLIQELAEKLDPAIVNFIETNAELLDDITALNFVEDVMSNEYHLSDSASLKQTADKTLKKYQKIKQRWYHSFLENVETHTDISDKRSIFNLYHQQHTILDSSQWVTLYGNLSLNELIEKKTEGMHTWKNTRNAFLIDCPFIMTKKKSTIYNSVRIDIIRNIYKIIKNDYYGNPAFFFKAYPKELITKPIFSPVKFELDSRQGQVTELVNDYIPDNSSGLLRTTLKYFDADTIFRSFTELDLNILSVFIANIGTDFYISRKVVMRLSDIGHAIYRRKRLSTKDYNIIATACTELGERTFKHYASKNTPGVAFSFFDHVVVDESTTTDRFVTAVFGDFLYNSLVQRKIIRVTSKNYYSLTNDLSKLLYYLIQNERVNAGILYRKLPATSSMVKKYDYTYFNQAVHFRHNVKKKNIQLLNSALDDFVKNKVAIKEYTFSEIGTWNIHYFPLSDAEYNDLSFENNNALFD